VEEEALVEEGSSVAFNNAYISCAAAACCKSASDFVARHLEAVEAAREARVHFKDYLSHGCCYGLPLRIHFTIKSDQNHCVM